jgi:hypothetical protein
MAAEYRVEVGGGGTREKWDGATLGLSLLNQTSQSKPHPINLAQYPTTEDGTITASPSPTQQ